MTTLIVGLGNIGEKYKNTRHNIGFMLTDYLAVHWGVKFFASANYYFAKKKDCVLVKPRTMMNLSGVAVKDAFKRFNPEKILIAFDDVNIDFAQLRIRKSGSAGGHNGVKSIIEKLQTDEFARLRIGVGGGEKASLVGHVLGNFTADQKEKLPEVLDFSAELLNVFINQDLTKMLEHYSKNKKTYSERIVQDL